MSKRELRAKNAELRDELFAVRADLKVTKITVEAYEASRKIFNENIQDLLYLGIIPTEYVEDDCGRQYVSWTRIREDVAAIRAWRLAEQGRNALDRLGVEDE